MKLNRHVVAHAVLDFSRTTTSTPNTPPAMHTKQTTAPILPYVSAVESVSAELIIII